MRLQPYNQFTSNHPEALNGWFGRTLKHLISKVASLAITFADTASGGTVSVSGVGKWLQDKINSIGTGVGNSGWWLRESVTIKPEFEEYPGYPDELPMSDQEALQLENWMDAVWQPFYNQLMLEAATIQNPILELEKINRILKVIASVKAYNVAYKTSVGSNYAVNRSTVIDYTSSLISDSLTAKLVNVTPKTVTFPLAGVNLTMLGFDTKSINTNVTATIYEHKLTGNPVITTPKNDNSPQSEKSSNTGKVVLITSSLLLASWAFGLFKTKKSKHGGEK